jgi:hypothetical protein
MNLKVKSNRLRDFVRHRDDLIIGGPFLVIPRQDRGLEDRAKDFQGKML